MELSQLKEKIEKLIFINNLLFEHGVETQQALYTLLDEIKEMETVYLAVKNKFESLI